MTLTGMSVLSLFPGAQTALSLLPPPLLPLQLPLLLRLPVYFDLGTSPCLATSVSPLAPSQA